MKLSKLSCSQWTYIGVFSTVYCLLGLIYTLQAPFYPGEAEGKGASALQYGLVSGVYAFTITAASPAMGYLIPHAGSKNLYSVGIICIGFSTVLFGCLHHLKDLTMFLGGSIGLRVLEGLGFSATYVAMFSFVPTLFPEHISFVTGILEMSNAVAFIFGPALGGYLFSLGGFPLPFHAVGAMMLLSIFFVLPTIWQFKFTDASPIEGLHTLALLRKFDVSINFLVIFLDAVTRSYLFTNLSEFLHYEFNMSELCRGIVFSAFGIFTGVLWPLWGYCMNKFPSITFQLILVGVVVKLVGSLLIGPVPLLQLPASFVSTVAGVSVFAFGNGMVLIAAYVNAPVQARSHGFPKDGTTSALVFGCGIACYSLGYGIGAPISGLFYDILGFRLGEFFVSVTELITLLILVAYFWAKQYMTCSEYKEKSERSPLLYDKNEKRIKNIL